MPREYSVPAIAEKMDRSVGGVAFKAQQLGLPLKARSQANDPEPADFNWTGATTGRLRPTNATEMTPPALEARGVLMPSPRA